MANLAVLFVIFILRSTDGASDGDLRLLLVEETTQGTTEVNNSTVSYICNSKQTEISLTSRTACGATTTQGHGPSVAIPGRRTGELCPDGWKHYRGSCYKYFGSSVNWGTARSRCQALGANLARIPDADHNNFISRMITGDTWFLLNDHGSEGNFRYSPTEPAPYRNFASGEPNDGGFWGGSEECVEIMPGGRWNDEECHNGRNYICGMASDVYWADDFQCTGNEATLASCTHSSWGSHQCRQSHAVEVSCSFTHTRGGLGASLMVNTLYRGVLQIRNAGSWRYICDRNFGTSDAKVACRQLARVPHMMFEYSSTTSGQSRVFQHMVGCSGGATGGRECSRVGEGEFFCADPSATANCLMQSQECLTDRYGEYCEHTCGQCAGGRCSLADGTCPDGDCKPGYTGPRCEEECGSGRWGRNCTEVCGSCMSGSCDKVDGSCDTNGCQVGYVGYYCKTPCPAGTWGAQCNKRCGHCKTGTCDVTTGRCAGDMCQAGYTGTFCTQACSEGLWGDGCGGSCGECVGSPCNKINGTCPFELCRKGYIGEQCKESCPAGKWGVNCENTCGKCKNPPCNPVTGLCDAGGCQTGYEGDDCFTANCDGACPECPQCQVGAQIGPQDGPDPEPACEDPGWAVATFVIMLLITLFCVIALVTHYLYRRYWLPRRKIETNE